MNSKKNRRTALSMGEEDQGDNELAPSVLGKIFAIYFTDCGSYKACFYKYMYIDWLNLLDMKIVGLFFFKWTHEQLDLILLTFFFFF